MVGNLRGGRDGRRRRPRTEDLAPLQLKKEWRCGRRRRHGILHTRWCLSLTATLLSNFPPCTPLFRTFPAKGGPDDGVPRSGNLTKFTAEFYLPAELPWGREATPAMPSHATVYKAFKIIPHFSVNSTLWHFWWRDIIDAWFTLLYGTVWWCANVCEQEFTEHKAGRKIFMDTFWHQVTKGIQN